MQRFQGLHVVSQNRSPTGPPAARKSAFEALWSKVRAIDKHDLVIWAACGVLTLTYCAVVAWGLGWLR